MVSPKEYNSDEEIISSLDEYSYDWKDEDLAGKDAFVGLNENVIKNISKAKNEDDWILKRRLEAYKTFIDMPNPDWGVDLSSLNYNEFKYFVAPNLNKDGGQIPPTTSWDELPDNIRKTYDKLGLPEAEKKRLIAGVAAQYESEMVYESIQADLQKQGVVFTSIEQGMKDYPDLIKKHFGSVVNDNDNKLSALNTAVFSGGSFVYIPKNIHVKIPLQAYFRMNTSSLGQFERTLIIADEGANVHYIEGCTAPIYSENSLHSGVVEIVVLKNAKVRYSTIQNWSNNVFNLVTQRALVHENARMEWVDANIGSKVTMKYPACVLIGENASGEVLSISLAANNQHQDTGAKMIHLAPNTHSNIVAKSVSRKRGRTSYRGLVKINHNANGSSSNVMCDALLVDNISRTDTYPTNIVHADDVKQGHEAVVSKVNEDQLFYLQSRGISESEAYAMIVRGFIDPIAKELPMEYALELNRLIELQMDGSIG